MEFNKKGILGRAKEAQQSAAVTDEGLRAYMLKLNMNYHGIVMRRFQMVNQKVDSNLRMGLLLILES